MNIAFAALWSWINGNKTVIGAVLANILPWFVIRGYMSGPTASLVMGLINAVTGLGLVNGALQARAAARKLSGKNATH